MTQKNVVPKVLMTPLYHLELVRDRELAYDADVKTTEGAAQVLHQLLDRSPTEQLVVLYLNSGLKIVGAERVGMGGVEQVGVQAQELFRGAILAASPEIIMSHNHPDGVVEPSVPDIRTTMRMLEIGALLGIRLRDHIVVGPDNHHMSIRENMHKLQDKFAQVSEETLVQSIAGLKDKLISMIDPNGKGMPSIIDMDLSPRGAPAGGKKKGGDPMANANTDWKDSLSYLVLSNL